MNLATLWDHLIGRSKVQAACDLLEQSHRATVARMATLAEVEESITRINTHLGPVSVEDSKPPRAAHAVQG